MATCLCGTSVLCDQDCDPIVEAQPYKAFRNALSHIAKEIYDTAIAWHIKHQAVCLLFLKIIPDLRNDLPLGHFICSLDVYVLNLSLLMQVFFKLMFRLTGSKHQK
jgi:hypothetical protein